MSTDMKTLREALDHLGDATDNGAGGGAANSRAGGTLRWWRREALDAALDELEALRAQDGVAEEALRQRDVAMAQRDEVLAALMKQGDEMRDLRDHLADVTEQRAKLARAFAEAGAAIAKARGGA